MRDALRRRLFFVRHRTSHILSIQSIITRNLGYKVSARDIKRLDESDVDKLFDDPYLRLVVRNGISAVRFLKERIKEIEGAVTSHAEVKPEFEYLQTMPGIGRILGLTIMLEVGDINPDSPSKKQKTSLIL